MYESSSSSSGGGGGGRQRGGRGDWGTGGDEMDRVDEEGARRLLKLTTDLARRTLSSLQGDDNQEEREAVRRSMERMVTALGRSQLVAAYGEDLAEMMERHEQPAFAVVHAKEDDEAVGIVEDFKKRFEAKVEDFQETLTEGEMRKMPGFHFYAEALDEVLNEFPRDEGGSQEGGVKSQSQKNNTQNGKENRRKNNSKSTKKSGKNGRESCGVSLVEDDGHIQTVDPITKRPITRPLRNTICGHVYDRHSILAMISAGKGRARCPYMGCVNPDPMTADNLVEDPVMAAKIKAKLSRIQNREEEGEEDMVTCGGRNSSLAAATPMDLLSTEEDDDDDEDE